MSDIILIPLVAWIAGAVGFAAGARWMWVIANKAIDEYEADLDGEP